MTRVITLTQIDEGYWTLEDSAERQSTTPTPASSTPAGGDSSSSSRIPWPMRARELGGAVRLRVDARYAGELAARRETRHNAASKVTELTGVTEHHPLMAALPTIPARVICDPEETKRLLRAALGLPDDDETI